MNMDKKNMAKDKRFGYFSFCPALVFSVAVLLGLSFSIGSSVAQAYPFIASTRGSFDLASGTAIKNVDLPQALSVLKGASCPGELAVYVHGVWASKEKAEEQTERVYLSLRNSGYVIPVIGFSWDSNTALSKQGWTAAKKIANENGPLLGKFVEDFKTKCPNDKLRIIAHSLGARVVLSALQWVHDNDNTLGNSISKKISSVHLLGAAVNGEQISKNPEDCIRFINPPLKCSGVAIESEVGHFYNLYDPEDNMLASERLPNLMCWICDPVRFPSPYQNSEGHDALGANGKGHLLNTPANYQEFNVLSKIVNDDDADEDNQCDIMGNWYFGYPSASYCTIDKQGDNHMGYMGFRSSANPHAVSNGGAIGLVASEWRNG
jgi:hypothetical protein